MLSHILENAGYSVCGEAETGEEAISKCDKLKPDLVTIDAIMPDMSGIKAIARLKKINPDAKIIVISSMAHRPYMLEAIKAGAVDYIFKPFTPDFVLRSIEKLM